MNDTSGQVRKLRDVSPLEKLCRMLRSTLRKYPKARLLNTAAAFGASLDEHTYMQVSYTGRWTAEDMRDCLVLFATWCVADPERLMVPGVGLDGVLRTVEQESAQSSTRRA